MQRPNINEVLVFLQNDFKERRDIEKAFNLSNIESWHLVRWLENGKFVEKITVKIEGRKSSETAMYRAMID